MKTAQEILAKVLNKSLEEIEDSEPIYLHQGEAIKAMVEFAEQGIDKAFEAGWQRRLQEQQANTFNGYKITAPDLEEYKKQNLLK